MSDQQTRVKEALGIEAKIEPLVALDATDFVLKDFPKRETFLEIQNVHTPVLTASSLNQIFAWRGTGKSMLSLMLAITLANGGGFLNWVAPRPTRVLYLDGEMPDDQIKDRLKLMPPLKQPGQLYLLTVGQQNGKGIEPLSSATGQRAVEAAIDATNPEVLIFDSISTLAWITTNDEKEWLDFLFWVNRLRINRKLCVIFLHHAGKSGMQRGHSRSEDQLDLSIKLSRDPADETENCKFLLQYDKVRADRTGIRELEVEFKQGKWTYQLGEAVRLNVLRQYLAEHPTASLRKIMKDIGGELGVTSLMTVGKLRRKLEETESGPASESGVIPFPEVKEAF